MFSHPFALGAVGVLILTIGAGCGGGRDESYATIQGTVKHDGSAVPSGARLVLQDKDAGVRMVFPIEEGGKFQVSETSKLPTGTYAVAVLPPATEADVTEANYDEVMNNPGSAPKNSSGTEEFPVPEKFRDPAKSGQTIKVEEGTQNIDIEF